MSLFTEFKEFAMKGNVLDMAVGVVIGAAFGKIVSSLVADIVTPAIGLAVGGVNFKDLAYSLGTDPAGQPILVKYGMFLQSIFDFIVIAVVIFMALRAINKLKARATAGGGSCTRTRRRAARRNSRPAEATALSTRERQRVIRDAAQVTALSSRARLSVWCRGRA